MKTALQGQIKFHLTSELPYKMFESQPYDHPGVQPVA